MSVLCLSNELLEEYLKFRFTTSFNKDVVTKLLTFIQPALVSKNQSSFFNDPSIAPQLTADPIINIVEPCNEEELVSQTVLKIQLVRSKNNNANFTQLNIQPISVNFENLNMLLAGQHSSSRNKQAAVKYIADLLSNAEFVKIKDRYIAADDLHWQQCKEVLEAILPKKELNPLRIITNNFQRHSDLKNIYSGWGVKAKQIETNEHDRYIETDKLIILLSSGLFHLSPNSNTDLTYVVKVKN